MILTRYIAIQVIQFVILALLLLAGMDSVFGFIAELEDVQESYGIPEAAFYVLATVPRRLYEFLPVSVLIGALFALGQMAQNSELVVMRAAAFSVPRIISAGLLAASFFAVFALMMAQWVVPPSEQFAQSYRSLQQGGGDVLRMKQGNWQKDDNTLVHIGALAPNGTVFGLSRFVFDQDQRLTSVTFSDRGTFHDGVWALEQTRVSELQLAPGTETKKIETRYEEHFNWATKLTPDMLAMIILQPDYLSITELYSYAQFLKQQDLSFQAFSLSFWKKLMQPLATLLMVMIALSFVFGPLRSVTMGFRITMGLVLGMLFYYCQDFLGYSSLVFNVPPFWAAFLPMVPFVGLAWFLLTRRA